MTHPKADYSIGVWSKTNSLNTSAASKDTCIHLIILLKNCAASNDTCKHSIIFFKEKPLTASNDTWKGCSHRGLMLDN